MLIPEIELHHSPKSSGFAEVNTCWWTLLLCWTTTVASRQLPDSSGKPLLVSIPHTCSAESSCLKCVASTLHGSLALAVQREASAPGDSKDCDVQRKLQQCHIFNGTGRNRRVRGCPHFSWMVLREEEWRKAVLTLILAKMSKGHLVKKVCMQRLWMAGARH